MSDQAIKDLAEAVSRLARAVRDIAEEADNDNAVGDATAAWGLAQQHV